MKLEDLLYNVINWWEAEDCSACPLHKKCQYEGIDTEEEPKCVEMIAEYFINKLEK